MGRKGVLQAIPPSPSLRDKLGTSIGNLPNLAIRAPNGPEGGITSNIPLPPPKGQVRHIKRSLHIQIFGKKVPNSQVATEWTAMCKYN